MIERNEKGEFVRIRCDNCNKPAPPDSDLIVYRGLNNMGWRCSGGTHLCQNCVTNDAPTDH